MGTRKNSPEAKKLYAFGSMLVHAQERHSSRRWRFPAKPICETSWKRDGTSSTYSSTHKRFSAASATITWVRQHVLLEVTGLGKVPLTLRALVGVAIGQVGRHSFHHWQVVTFRLFQFRFFYLTVRNVTKGKRTWVIKQLRLMWVWSTLVRWCVFSCFFTFKHLKKM